MGNTQQPDYRALLLRYIRHVGTEEGTDFLTYRNGSLSDPEWTDAEWAELQRLREESYDMDGG